MHIGQPSHGAPVGWSTGGHLAREFRDIRLLAVTTATGWTRPRAGFTQTFQHLSKGSMHRPHQALFFFSASRGATVACQKSGIYPRFDSAAGLGQIPLIPGQIPYLILRVTGFDSASGPIPVNGKHWVGRIAPGTLKSICVIMGRRLSNTRPYRVCVCSQNNTACVQ